MTDWRQKKADAAKRAEVLTLNGAPKPCPCCGHLTPQYVVRTGRVYGKISGRVPWWREQVKCKCGLQTAEQTTPGKALKIWNKEYDPIEGKEVTDVAYVSLVRDARVSFGGVEYIVENGLVRDTSGIVKDFCFSAPNGDYSLLTKVPRDVIMGVL